MKLCRLTLVVALLMGVSSLSAQTIIDLRKGGVTARAKDKSDYDNTAVLRQEAEQTRQDSLEYVECLTRGFNDLACDSLRAATERFERCLKLRPTAPGNYVVHRQLGRINMVQGQYKPAAEHFSAVLREKPEDAESRLMRATCYVSLEYPQQTLDDCRELFRVATDTMVAERILFLQYAAHTQLRQHQEARTDLLKILRMNPGNESAQLLQCLNLEQIGQPQEALNRLNLFVEAHPQDVEALLARADMERRQGYPLLADEDIKTAKALLKARQKK